MNIVGKWRITEMETWNRDAIDLVGPAFIEFTGQGGQFHFIVVDGWMACRHKDKNGRPHVEFTWSGNDECDPASGHGWARMEKDGTLTGRIYIHQGDDSAFKATLFVEEPKPVVPRASTQTK